MDLVLRKVITQRAFQCDHLRMKIFVVSLFAAACVAFLVLTQAGTSALLLVAFTSLLLSCLSGLGRRPLERWSLDWWKDAAALAAIGASIAGLVCSALIR